MRKKKRFEIGEGKEPVGIYDCLVKSMTTQINHRQSQDPRWVCPKSIQLWKDEINIDNEKKMMEFWDISIQAEKGSTS